MANDPSTKLEPEEEIVVDGMKIIDPKTGNAPAFQADGIALDRENRWLYYHALTGKTMYRIKTEYLLDESLSPVQLGTKVENFGTTPKPDGMLEGKKGIAFLTAIEKDAIARFDPESRKTTIVIQDKRLQWPTRWLGAGRQAFYHHVADPPDAQIPRRRERAAETLYGVQGEVALSPQMFS